MTIVANKRDVCDFLFAVLFSWISSRMAHDTKWSMTGFENHTESWTWKITKNSISRQTKITTPSPMFEKNTKVIEQYKGINYVQVQEPLGTIKTFLLVLIHKVSESARQNTKYIEKVELKLATLIALFTFLIRKT